MKITLVTASFIAAGCAALLLAYNCSALSIVGALSNFDLTNDTGEDCDEFEMIISNTVPAQIYGTWIYNPHYGTPTVSDLGGATRIHYAAQSNNLTAPSGIEHFGVILPAFPTNGILYTWMHAGTNVGPGRQFPMPLLSLTSVPVTEANREGHGRHREMRNSDRTNTYWIQRHSMRTNRNVSLDELMATNAVVLTTTNVDDHPKRIRPGDSLSDDDDVTDSDDTSSEVLAMQVYADDNGKPGSMIGNFMYSSQTIRRSRAESVHRHQDGRHSVDFTVEPGTNYVIQASDDLLHWTNIGTLNTNQPVAQYTDDKSTNYSSRYYRLQQP